MTEAEWLACTRFEPLWVALAAKASVRQRRLFWCAAARLHWEHITDKRLRKAVEVAERFADGLASEKELDSAHAAAERAGYINLQAKDSAKKNFARSQARTASGPENTLESGWTMSLREDRGDSYDPGPEGWARLEILRDLIGNPFRVIAVDPAWLRWNDGTVEKLARTIYDERAFDRMPILADALEDAGCTDADILAHCRGPGPHVLGCWLLDRILARE
jgi:hypothetical protein